MSAPPSEHEPIVPSAAAAGVASLVEARSVSKRYGATQALDRVDFALLRPGEIHGLIGENGSGKSTLLSILSGQVQPDSGQVFVGGAARHFSSPHDAVAQGISMVAQETALALDLSVAENILMGHRMPRSRRMVTWDGTYRRAELILHGLGVDYDPTAPVRALRPDQRQMVEIARGIAAEAKVVILDEPTSSLAGSQAEGLFDAMRRLAASGVCFVFVSHRLPELYEMTDRLSVLRDGRLVNTADTAGYPQAQLVRDMVGDSKAVVAIPRAAQPADDAEPRLTVRGLRSLPVVADVSITLRPGEIVGLAGLAGAGRSEILECIYGLRAHEGVIEANGTRLSGRVTQSLDAGLAYVPPDRRSQGLIGPMSVAANLAISVSRRANRLARPNVKAERSLGERARTELRFRGASVDMPVLALSGGNQQKIVLGRCLATDPQILLLDEPTRGVDVGAKGEIHQLLGEAADHGLSILISSSDSEELLAVCDRIVVINRGVSVADVPVAEATEQTLFERTGGYR